MEIIEVDIEGKKRGVNHDPVAQVYRGASGF